MDNSGGGVNEVNLFDWGNFENQSRMLGEELTPDFSTQVTPEQMENRGKNPNQELNIAEMTREGEQVASAEQGRNPGLENAIGIVTVGATEMVGAPTVAQMSGVLPHDNLTTEEIAIDAPEVARDGDKMEKDWMERARRAVNETKGDPNKRLLDVALLREEYMRKRFNRILGDRNDVTEEPVAA